MTLTLEPIIEEFRPPAPAPTAPAVEVFIGEGRPDKRRRANDPVRAEFTPPPRETMSIAEARKANLQCVKGFIADAEAWHSEPEATRPPAFQIALACTTGTGKTRTAIECAATMIATMRDKGDGRTFVLATPRHDLNDEIARNFLELPEVRSRGLSAMILRGREQPDPETPGQKMCLRADDLEIVTRAGIKAGSLCSGKTDTGEVIKCPLFDQCGYQRSRSRKADLVLMPHEYLFHEKPSAVGEIFALIIDEDVTGKSIRGTGKRPIELPLDVLTKYPEIPNDPVASGDLQGGREALLRACEIASDGNLGLDAGPRPLTREALKAAGFNDPDRTQTLWQYEWRLKYEPAIHPGLSTAEIKKRAALAAGNPVVAQRVRLWRAAHALLAGEGEQSGWAKISRNASDARVITLHWREEIAKGWKVPTLLADAQFSEMRAKFLFPNLRLPVTRIEVAPDPACVKIRQTLNEANPHSSIVPQGPDDRAAINRIKSLRDRIIASYLREGGVDTLVVIAKGAKQYLADLGLPANIHLLHHGATAGRDSFGSVGLHIIIGRMLMPREAAEAGAEALSGRYVVPEDYKKTPEAISLSNGETWLVNSWRHSDPLADDIRAASEHNELMQAEGRSRRVNRTTENPLVMEFWTNVPLPQLGPIHEGFRWEDEEPDPTIRQLALGGIAFESPADAARAYPGLYPSEDAAKKAFKRSRDRQGQKTMSDSPISNSSPSGGLRAVRYRLALARSGFKTAYVSPILRDASPEAVQNILEAWLGPIASVEVETPIAAPSEARDRREATPATPAPDEPDLPASGPPERPGIIVNDWFDINDILAGLFRAGFHDSAEHKRWIVDVARERRKGGNRGKRDGIIFKRYVAEKPEAMAPLRLAHAIGKGLNPEFQSMEIKEAG